ncbi:MAG: response regulator [Eubacteriales bacterium]|nr:response regulator [Eubacteriales bacterium]
MGAMELDILNMSEKEISKLGPETVRALAEENVRLRQELQVRDNDILSHDQVFDSIVTGSFHLILVMSTTTYEAEFITSNIETAIGVSREEAMKDVRRIGNSFENIEMCHGKEEFYIHRTTGARRQYLTYVIHLPYGRSDRVAVVLLCRTNTARGDLDDMMLRQTQDANRAAGYFLASMSHDFRVPINSISGFVMLLMKNAHNPAKVMEYSHRIGVSCQEILTTVDQILDMSRIETGDTVLESEEFGLGLMLEELSTLFSSLAKARNQTFIFTARGIEHDIVLGDRARLMEMLRGVLSNAVKFTPPGGRVELTVTGTPDETGDTVSMIFEVRDTGAGMDQDQVEMYFRGTIPTNAQSTPGRGTGIWLTRKLIDMMGGTISAQSRPGEGTILWIRLRLSVVNSGTTDFWVQRGVRKMLIVCGNLQEGARIRNLMVSAGVDATSISSGFGTVKMIEHAGSTDTGFDIVLLDEELQDMEWREVVGSIHAMSWIRMPMIVLMSNRQIRDEERRGAGIGYVLPKPFYISALHRMVAEVFEKRSGDVPNEFREGEYSMEGLRFLAAEDNALNADVLKELLEASGARCEIARNGRAALAMFSNARPGTYDVILLDLLMPVMDGYAAAAAIRALQREDAKTIPILAMTASTYEQDIQRTFESGMDAHITKPLDIRVLAGHIHRLRAEQRIGSQK